MKNVTVTLQLRDTASHKSMELDSANNPNEQESDLPRGSGKEHNPPSFKNDWSPRDGESWAARGRAAYRGFGCEVKEGRALVSGLRGRVTSRWMRRHRAGKALWSGWLTLPLTPPNSGFSGCQVTGSAAVDPCNPQQPVLGSPLPGDPSSPSVLWQQCRPPGPAMCSRCTSPRGSPGTSCVLAASSPQPNILSLSFHIFPVSPRLQIAPFLHRRSQRLWPQRPT